MTDRARLYKLLAIGRRQLGWTEAQYRNYLALHGATCQDGRVSATTLTDAQLQAAYRGLQEAGFRPRRAAVARLSDWRQPRIAKITALWCALADAGVVHDRSERAMRRWCAGVTRVAQLEWCSSAQMNDCIERLKRWAHRERVALAR